MCGRYVIEEDGSVDIRALYEELAVTAPSARLKRGEIFPTDTVPILCRTRDSARPYAPAPAVWGIPSPTGKGIVINARAETASEKPLFSESLARRRCVIPTLGYYEWSRDKSKHRFSLPDAEVTYLCGLWRKDENGIPRFAVLTTAANDSVSAIHPRMPLLLPAHRMADWLHDPAFAVYHLRAAMPPLRVTAVGI